MGQSAKPVRFSANKCPNDKTRMLSRGVNLDTACDLVARLDLPGGSYIENSHDDLGRLLSTALKRADDTVLNSHSYVYNNGHQRTKQTFAEGNYVDYTYDGIGQLKTAKGKEQDNTSRLHEQFGQAYDKAWNLNYTHQQRARPS